MKTIKFVVVGFGHIGRRHATIASEYPGAVVVGIVDINPEAKKHDLFPKGAQFYNSVDEFLEAKVKADIVNIATPNGYHCPYAIKFLEAGYHVVIEKPMGLTKAECEQVIFKSLQVSRQVFVVKQNRYSPPSKWMKEVVGNKTIGDVLMVQVNCYWNRDNRYYKAGGWKGSLKLDGGTLFTQFSHFIDLLYWIIGDIKNVKGFTGNYAHQGIIEFEDSGVFAVEFYNGAIGSINYTVNSYKKNMEGSLTIFAEKGSVKIGGQYLNELEYQCIENFEIKDLPVGNTANNYGQYQGSMSNHDKIYANLVDVLSNNAAISTSAFEGLKTVEIIDKMYNAANK